LSYLPRACIPRVPFLLLPVSPRYGTEDTEADKALLEKVRSGAEVTKDERLRVRDIMARRQKAQSDEDRAAAARNSEARAVAYGGGGDGAPASGGGLAAPSSAGTLAKIRMAATASPKEELEIEKLLALTRAYFALVKKQVVDLVPKYIQLLLVEEPKELITKRIGAMTDRQVAELMMPSEDVTARRAETIAALAKLREAESMLYDVSQLDTLPPR